MVGGMMVIELLAGKMRLDRGGIAAVEDDMRQTYTVKHIRKCLTLLPPKFGECSVGAQSEHSWGAVRAQSGRSRPVRLVWLCW